MTIFLVKMTINVLGCSKIRTAPVFPGHTEKAEVIPLLMYSCPYLTLLYVFSLIACQQQE